MEATLEPVRYFDDGDGVYAILALEAYPQIAERIGVLLGCFSVAEITMRDLLAKLLSVSQDEAHDILGHIRSHGLRVKLIESIASTNPENSTKETIRNLLTEVDWLAKERNKYAHSFYAMPKDESDQRLIRVAFFSDQKKKPSYDEMTVAGVDADIARAKNLLILLWQTLRA